MKGSAHLIWDKLQDIYKRSLNHSLSAEIEASITPSTLDAPTLKFLATLVHEAKATTVLELGSGLSTRMLNRVLSFESPDSHLVSIDNSVTYLEKTRQSIEPRIKITYYLAPIRPYLFRGKAFATYDPSVYKRIPSGTTFDLVIIDGPLGFRFGREAPLYLTAPFLTSSTLILVDDSNRSPEQTAMVAWRRVWLDKIKMIQFSEIKKGLAIISLPSPNKMAIWPFSPIEIIRSWIQLPRKLNNRAT